VSRYRWTILALGTVAQASYSAVFLGIPVLAPQFREEYGLTLTQVGVVIAAVSIGSVVTLLPWGLLTDRFGERLVLASGLAAASVALAVAAFSSVYGALVALLVVAGASGASVNAASGRAVLGWFEPSERGFALGIRQTALPLGGAAAALFLPPIAASGAPGPACWCSPEPASRRRSPGRSACGRRLRTRARRSGTSCTRSATGACGDWPSGAASSSWRRSASWRSRSSSSTACAASRRLRPQGCSRSCS
jgi:nitrate/nitrite transporter NarK